MRQDIPNSPNRGSVTFQQIADTFLAQDGLPFADVLTSEQIERAFARNDGLFGQHGVYSTAIVLWAFLSQVLRDGKEASCQSAVARITSHCLHEGVQPPTHDTGDYCKARGKLSETALHELGQEVAEELQQRADKSWLWKDRHAKLIDGFTFTMPDTPKNAAEFPHPRTQKKGVGLPIARAVAILSLATACVMDAVIGPYKGKETGEPALLRSILTSLHAGDIAVFDRCYCSFMMIALLQLQGTDVCARLHQMRRSDFRTGQRLGKGDHLIVWSKPARPDWMDQETYDRIPETLELRELRYAVVEKGRRTKIDYGGYHADGRNTLPRIIHHGVGRCVFLDGSVSLGTRRFAGDRIPPFPQPLRAAVGGEVRIGRFSFTDDPREEGMSRGWHEWPVNRPTWCGKTFRQSPLLQTSHQPLPQRNHGRG